MRNLGLDIIRFFAVLLVVGHHYNFSTFTNWIFKAWIVGGWVGVDLFFVISGYLISSLLFREYQNSGTVNLKRFLIRRGFKIYPPFWLLTLVSVIIFSATKQKRTGSEIITELLFIQNYLPGVWLFTWSLAIEEHFYLGLALLFKILKSIDITKSIKFIPIICVSICVLVLFMRFRQIINVEHYFYFMYHFRTDLRIDALCFGVLISYLVYFKNLQQTVERIPAKIPVLVGLLMLLPAFIYPRETDRWVLIWGLTIFYIGSALIVLGASKLNNSTSKLLNFLGSLGAASYSIYLWHMPVRIWFLPLLIKTTQLSNPAFSFGVYVFSTFIIGWIMHLLVEKPVLALRDYFYKDATNELPVGVNLKFSPGSGVG
ncbi:MAG: acyltransferase [Deltaproteobacteria bacterium]|nr:acyltransferase [Deltaproteobacteria bacterium]